MRRTMRGLLFLSFVLNIKREVWAHPLVDSRGLEFVSLEAFCRYHCSAFHRAQVYRHLSDESECLEPKCGPFLATTKLTRQLRPAFSFLDNTKESAALGDVHGASDDGKNVTIISVVTCSSVTDVTLSIGDPERDEFADFYTAFATAYEAMVSGQNATYDACQLQFLQKELLTDSSLPLDDAVDDMEVRPSLIKFKSMEYDEMQCLQEIKTIWPSTRERKTPFLTQSTQKGVTSTVMLVHVSPVIGDEILALDCVESVTVLPAILKLMPFAKSSYALSRDSTKSKEGPALEIRLAKGVKTEQAFKRLAARVTHATGIANMITLQRGTAVMGGVLVQAAVDDYDTWTQALAVVLDDQVVEWVDLLHVVSTSALKNPSFLEHQLLQTQFDDATKLQHMSRRLDEHVQDLVGVNILHERNITGNSIVVGITDTGLYIDHDQFDQKSRKMYDGHDLSARKVVYYQTFANNVDEAEGVTCGHGTHVSGILAGSSYSRTSRDLGIASSARIAFMDIGKQEVQCAGTSGCPVSLETPGEVTNLMKAQVDAGAKIFSFSWGTGANDYNMQTEQVDEYVYNNPEILIVVAAGNSGKLGSYTISSPSGAKNVLSVGASLNSAASFAATPCQGVLNEKTVASFSSIGPTLDGRQKPDLVAPGMSIISSQSEEPGSTVKSSAVCPLQGTSQATPVVAGMAVLIYEWLRDGWWKNGVANPAYGLKVVPASLLKALLLHSSEALSQRLIEPTAGVTSCVALEAAAQSLQAYPDHNQGYGKPTMRNLVTFMDGKSASGAGSGIIYFFPNSSAGSEPSVTEGKDVTFPFTLTEGVNLRVTLVWTDPPGSVGGKATLQNDLDLTLRIANTTAIFYPLSGRGKRDSVNNVEMAEVSYDEALEAMAKSGMTVENGHVFVQAVVTGHSVKAGENAATSGQKFALVASSTPSLTSKTLADAKKVALWQPWMTIGAIVVATLVLLFIIALGWRLRARARARNLKAEHGTPSAGIALTGTEAHRNRRERQQWANEEPVSAPHIHPNYRNVEGGNGQRVTLEELRTTRRGYEPTLREPSLHAAAVHEPSRRNAGALDFAPSRQPSRRAAAALAPGGEPPRRNRLQWERNDGNERRRERGRPR